MAALTDVRNQQCLDGISPGLDRFLSGASVLLSVDHELVMPIFTAFANCHAAPCVARTDGVAFSSFDIRKYVDRIISHLRLRAIAHLDVGRPFAYAAPAPESPHGDRGDYRDLLLGQQPHCQELFNLFSMR
jgi:hypothetical protein